MLTSLRPRLPAVLAPLLIAGFIVVAHNQSFWRALHAAYPAGAPWAVIAALGLGLMWLLAALLQLVNFRWLFKPVAMLLLFGAALASYFMDRFGVVIDVEMYRNIMQTDSREAGELMTGALYLHLLLYGVLPIVALALVRLRRPPLRSALWQQPAAVVACALLALLCVLTVYKDVSLTVRQHRELRLLINPSYPLYSFFKYRRQQAGIEAGPLLTVAADAQRAPLAAGARPRLLVLVVGETARAMQFSLNGYTRDTNPELRQLDVISYADVSACGTSTAESVPCMFSHLSRNRFVTAEAAQQENLLDIMQRVGVAVQWRDNNAGCKSVCERVPNLRPDDHPLPGLCVPGECFDEILLQGLQQYLDERSGDTLLVLHQMGSHGPAYYKRVPPAFRRFTPECAREDVTACPRQHIINSYDNTILYTDHFLAALIGLLQQNAARFDAAMLYASDHGESLGELGLYLHGFPYRFAPREQTRVPMILWATPQFYARESVSAGCMRNASRASHSHDNIFHTVLGVFDVRSASYDPALDLFSACRK